MGNGEVAAVGQTAGGGIGLKLADYGGKADGIVVQDATVANGSRTLSSASLTVADVGKTVMIDGAGAGGATLVTTIDSADTGTAALHDAASTSVTSAMAVWGTDDSPAWAGMLDDCYQKGGGIMSFEGVSLVTARAALPNDNTMWPVLNGGNQPNNTPAVGPFQPPMRITGNGPVFDGQWTGRVFTHGSILVTSSTGPLAHIVTKGLGVLELDHFTILAMAGESVPLVYTTNTTLKIHHLAFCGRRSRVRGTCDQDVLLLGGTSTTLGTGDDAPFQGYGFSLTDCYFDRIRRVITAQVYANALIERDNVISSTCGSNQTDDAPFVIGMPGYTDTTHETDGHTLGPDIVEVPGYSYVYIMNNAKSSVLHTNIFDDTGNLHSVVRTSFGSTRNIIFPRFRGGVVDLLQEGEPPYESNRIVAPDYYVEMQKAAAQEVGYGQVTQVLFDSVALDTTPLANCGHTATGAIKIPVAGRWLIQIQLAWDPASSDGTFYIAGYSGPTEYHDPSDVDWSTMPGFHVQSCLRPGASLTRIVNVPKDYFVSAATFQDIVGGAPQPLLIQNCFLTAQLL